MLNLSINSNRSFQSGDLDGSRRLRISITGHTHELSTEETTREFFQNPIIRGYLSRDVESVSFSEKHPMLIDSKTKEEHEHTDHYELKVYKYLENIIAYRNQSITNPMFYTTGTTVDKNLLSIFKLNDVSDDIELQVKSDNGIEQIAENIMLRQFSPHSTTEKSPRIFGILPSERFTCIDSNKCPRS